MNHVTLDHPDAAQLTAFVPGESRKGASAGTFTASGQVVGSVDYIAPEQGHDAHHADIRSDIYSLGCTLYYLLAGHSPFGGESLAEKLAAHEGQTPESLAAVRIDLPAALGAGKT
jgi:serine/threonine protein kinase